MKVRTAIALAVSVLMLSCKRADPDPVFLGRFAPSHISVPLGTVITVELPAFNGAQYMWEVDFKPKLLQETAPLPNPARAGEKESQMPGSVYLHAEGFKAIKKGKEKLVMRNCRPGDKSRSDEIWERTITITD